MGKPKHAKSLLAIEDDEEPDTKDVVLRLPDGWRVTFRPPRFYELIKDMGPRKEGTGHRFAHRSYYGTIDQALDAFLATRPGELLKKGGGGDLAALHEVITTIRNEVDRALHVPHADGTRPRSEA